MYVPSIRFDGSTKLYWLKISVITGNVIVSAVFESFESFRVLPKSNINNITFLGNHTLYKIIIHQALKMIVEITVVLLIYLKYLCSTVPNSILIHKLNRCLCNMRS